MNRRPFHIWLLIALLAVFAANLLYGLATAAIYLHRAGQLQGVMSAYVPTLLYAGWCSAAGLFLYLRRAWVRWLFLVPVVVAALQLVALAPYVFLSFHADTDPAAKAAIHYMLGGLAESLLLVAGSIAVAVVVFKYFRQEKSARLTTFRMNGRS